MRTSSTSRGSGRRTSSAERTGSQTFTMNRSLTPPPENASPRLEGGDAVPSSVEGPLRERWAEPLGAVAALPPLELSGADPERPRTYCLLLMALIPPHWTPLKRGREGRYPWCATPDPDPPYAEYLGHNIAALA